MGIHFWLMVLAWASLVLALGGAAAIGFDEARHPQKMRVMNWVWPLTSLYAPVLGLWLYFAMGRGMAADRVQGHERPHAMDAQNRGRAAKVDWRQIAISTSHCGAGCALGDIVGESLVFAAGWSLWGEPLYADYAVTLVLAWVLGIAFQYFSIKPMRGLGAGEALAAAVKADTLSILFFQVGMYGWMAVVHFVLFAAPHLEPNSAVFWLMMQIGMLLGCATAWPVNGWLLRSGLKERMG